MMTCASPPSLVKGAEQAREAEPAERLNPVRVQRCGKSVTSRVERLWLGKPR